MKLFLKKWLGIADTKVLEKYIYVQFEKELYELKINLKGEMQDYAKKLISEIFSHRTTGTSIWENDEFEKLRGILELQMRVFCEEMMERERFSFIHKEETIDIIIDRINKKQLNLRQQ